MRLSFFGLMFGLYGRIGRGAYMLATILLVLVFLLWGYAYAVESQAGGVGYGTAGHGSSLQALLSLGPTYLIAFLIIVWSCFAVAIKRTHDLGYSGWWIVGVSASQYIAPEVLGNALGQVYSGVLSLGVGALLLLLQGQDGLNGYGPSPKGSLFGRGPQMGPETVEPDGLEGSGLLDSLMESGADGGPAAANGARESFAAEAPVTKRGPRSPQSISNRAAPRGFGKRGR